MNIGKLNKRITIQQLEPVPDGMGGWKTDDDNWVNFSTVWASVDTLKAWESFKAQSVESNVTHRIIIRYKKGLDTKMQIKYNKRAFNITAILDKEEKHIFLELLCSELV